MYYYEIYVNEGCGCNGSSFFFRHEKKLVGEEIVSTFLKEETEKEKEKAAKGIAYVPFDSIDAEETQYAKEITKEEYEHAMTAELDDN